MDEKSLIYVCAFISQTKNKNFTNMTKRTNNGIPSDAAIYSIP